MKAAITFVILAKHFKARTSRFRTPLGFKQLLIAALEPREVERHVSFEFCNRAQDHRGCGWSIEKLIVQVHLQQFISPVMCAEKFFFNLMDASRFKS